MSRLRQSHGASPGKKVEVQISASAATRAMLEPRSDLIELIANASSVSFDAEGKPKGAATAVVRDLEIHVLGVVDVDNVVDWIWQSELDPGTGQFTNIERAVGIEGNGDPIGIRGESMVLARSTS